MPVCEKTFQASGLPTRSEIKKPVHLQRRRSCAKYNAFYSIFRYRWIICCLKTKKNWLEVHVYQLILLGFILKTDQIQFNVKYNVI